MKFEPSVVAALVTKKLVQAKALIDEMNKSAVNNDLIFITIIMLK